MPRMRTLTETLNHIKEMDPKTAITANALRCMVISNQVPHIKAGKKYLIDLDMLFEYLKGSIPEEDHSDSIYRNRESNFRKQAF